jgi:hypothetical protein
MRVVYSDFGLHTLPRGTGVSSGGSFYGNERLVDVLPPSQLSPPVSPGGIYFFKTS